MSVQKCEACAVNGYFTFITENCTGSIINLACVTKTIPFAGTQAFKKTAIHTYLLKLF